MIVGCYTLDLYCDNEGASCHEFDEFPHSYGAEFGSQCRAEARRDGWKLHNGQAICPKCNRKGEE